MSIKGRPRREIVSKELGHNAGNSGTYWVLRLSCGHQAVRPRQAGKGNGNWKYHKLPKYVYCKRCGEGR